MEFLKFDELEKKISGLIGDYALLKKRNLELEELLQIVKGSAKAMGTEEDPRQQHEVEGDDQAPDPAPGPRLLNLFRVQRDAHTPQPVDDQEETLQRPPDDKGPGGSMP